MYNFANTLHSCLPTTFAVVGEASTSLGRHQEVPPSLIASLAGRLLFLVLDGKEDPKKEKKATKDWRSRMNSI